jgi:cold-inducible RNA-binding protein
LESFEMKIYVGNLSYNTTQAGLEEKFSAFGQVDEVAIINDRETGRPRGFAFVTMANHEEGLQAIEGMNGVDLDGRTLTVNEARPKPAGGGGHGGGGGPRRRGGSGGGGGRW